MGVSNEVFPTAEHSRFTHSIGAYGTAREIFLALKQKEAGRFNSVPAFQFDDDAERAFCAAAMCHDLGHTAFSHVLESVLLPSPLRRHEQCSLALLQHDSELRSAVKKYTGDIEAVILLLSDKRSSPGHAHPNSALSALISGPLDADRADFLLRDSQGAGVHYGMYDFSWLLHALSVGTNEAGRPVLLLDGPRGLDVLRQFLAARRYMYRHVYFHPTTRSAQLVLKGIFERILEVSPDKDVISLAPPGLKNLARHDPITLDDFIRTADLHVIYFIQQLAEAKIDPVLRELCERFITRKYPKCVVDSAKHHVPLDRSHGIRDADSEQYSFWMDGDVIQSAEVLEKCRDFVATRLKRRGVDPDLAKYIVYEERLVQEPDDLEDLWFCFSGTDVNYKEVDHAKAGYTSARLTETFELYRLFGHEDYCEELSRLIPRLRRPARRRL